MAKPNCMSTLSDLAAVQAARETARFPMINQGDRAPAAAATAVVAQATAWRSAARFARGTVAQTADLHGEAAVRHAHATSAAVRQMRQPAGRGGR
jgi:hypothetical protein